MPSHGEMPKWIDRRLDTYAPVPKNAACPSDTCPAIPPRRFQATPSSAVISMRIAVFCQVGRVNTNGKTSANTSASAAATHRARRLIVAPLARCGGLAPARLAVLASRVASPRLRRVDRPPPLALSCLPEQPLRAHPHDDQVQRQHED